jgi:hypothetical protein
VIQRRGRLPRLIRTGGLQDHESPRPELGRDLVGARDVGHVDAARGIQELDSEYGPVLRLVDPALIVRYSTGAVSISTFLKR